MAPFSLNNNLYISVLYMHRSNKKVYQIGTLLLNYNYLKKINSYSNILCKLK